MKKMQYRIYIQVYRETNVWVTYGIGVYDITKFIPQHPGSDKVMLAAGGAIDPFWHTYQQHNTKEILELLETYRIGNFIFCVFGQWEEISSHERKLVNFYCSHR